MSELARRLGKHVGSIRIYLRQLEEWGVIEIEQRDRVKYVRLLADKAARLGDATVLFFGNNVMILNCPFKDVCPYYKEGCIYAEDCMLYRIVQPLFAVTEELNRALASRRSNLEEEK